MADNNAAKKTDDEIPTTITAEKKSSGPQKPLLLIGVAVMNMIVMAGVVFFLWSAHKKEKAQPKLQDVIKGEQEDHAKQAGKEEEGEDIIGKLVPMETFLVNLAGTRGHKLVKINMELEVDGQKVEEEIDKRKPQIRDIIIILLSSKTYDQVTTSDGKVRLRDEIRDQVNSFLVKGKIKKVYFTDFIVN